MATGAIFLPMLIRFGIKYFFNMLFRIGKQGCERFTNINTRLLKYTNRWHGRNTLHRKIQILFRKFHDGNIVALTVGNVGGIAHEYIGDRSNKKRIIAGLKACG